MTQFTVGNVYQSRFIGDHELHIDYKVVRRTAKFVTFLDLVTNEEFRVKPYISADIECYSHHGEHICANWNIA